MNFNRSAFIINVFLFYSCCCPVSSMPTRYTIAMQRVFGCVGYVLSAAGDSARHSLYRRRFGAITSPCFSRDHLLCVTCSPYLPLREQCAFDDWQIHRISPVSILLAGAGPSSYTYSRKAEMHVLIHKRLYNYILDEIRSI